MSPEPSQGPGVNRHALARAGLLVAIGVGVGGIIGGLAALAGLGIGHWRGPRAVAASAFGMLLLAALLTVLEAPATGRASDYLFDFALDRPDASDAGLAAGVLALVAIVLAARVERAGSAPPMAGPNRETRADGGTSTGDGASGG